MAEEEEPVLPEENGASERLRLNIKTAQRKIEVDVSVDTTVKELKELLTEKLDGIPSEQLCLIFAGRILKDLETLVSQGVKDGVAVHLVVRQGTQNPSGSASSQGSATSASSASTSSASQRPTPSQATGVGPPLASPFGAGAMGSGDLARMQQQLMSNPELMRQMMESPMMQSLMSNPDALQSLLTSNPQIQELMERNPELTHILHNPELMRQAMEMARNPAALRELMRSQDRQLSNIESLPGGFNALARMYTEIQEPMMDAAQESLQQQLQNPFSALLQQSTPSPGPSAPQGTANTSPLPNPWVATPPTSSGSSTRGTSSSSTTRSQPTGPPTTTASSLPSGTSGSSAFMGGASGGHQAVLQQEMERLRDNPEEMQRMMQMSLAAQSGNPEMVSQMMNNPAVQSAMEQMMNDPQLMEQMFRSHPLTAGNPQVGALAQQASQMMQQNEFRQLMSNPEAMQAMLQIQQGMMQLQQTAPGMLGQSLQGVGATPTASGTGATPGGGGGAGSGQLTPDQLQQMLSSVALQSSGGSGAVPQYSSTPPTAPPPQPRQGGTSRIRLYESEMQQLQSMGFADRQANMQALIDTGGDINAAVERLLR